MTKTTTALVSPSNKICHFVALFSTDMMTEQQGAVQCVCVCLCQGGSREASGSRWDRYE